MNLCATDVLIAGAGPAGLACAIAAANQGLRVEVVDAMQPPIDKACGEGLMPDSLEALAALGFDLNHDLDKCETALLRGIRFIGERAMGDAASCSRIFTTQATFPGAPGRGMRRPLLHQLLLDKAASLGVRFHWETVVQGFSERGEGTEVRTNRSTLRARYLVGSDGHQSRVGMWAGLTASTLHSRRIGLRQHYAVAPWTDFVEVYWGRQGQAYVTPVSATEVCVAFISRDRFTTPAQALEEFPTLARRLALAVPSGSARGSITLGRTLDRVTCGNVALIGDASGSVDAVTGEGMALCFRQAAALSVALKAGKLSGYEQAHRRIQRLPSFMSRSLLLMDRSPLARALVLATFERNPNLFSRLLKVHIGQSPWRIRGGEVLPAAEGVC